MKRQHWSWLCSLYSGDLGPLCVRVMVPALNVWLHAVVAQALSPWVHGAHSARLLREVAAILLHPPHATCSSAIPAWPPRHAATPPMFALAAGQPGGEPKWRPNLSGSFLPLLPHPKKVCRRFFYKWVRSGGWVGQGMKCLRWELWDRERCWWSPACLQLDKLDVVRSPGSCSLLSSLVGLCCHVSPAPADTGTAVAVWGRMKCYGAGRGNAGVFLQLPFTPWSTVGGPSQW